VLLHLAPICRMAFAGIPQQLSQRPQIKRRAGASANGALPPGKRKRRSGRTHREIPEEQLTADIYWQLGAEAFNDKQYKQGWITSASSSENSRGPAVAQGYFYMAECYFNLEDYANAAPAYKNFTLNFPQDANKIQRSSVSA